MPKVIEYHADLEIANTKMLGPGLGLKYLECIAAHVPGVLIAKKWHREMPSSGDVIVDFSFYRAGY